MHDVDTTLPRRTFLQLIGFSAAALTLDGCSAPEQKIVPFLTQPAEMTPGVAAWYASTCMGCSAACGILVKVREGRPIKLEGNPDHPMSRGGLCPIAHAMVFDLFDSARLQGPRAAGADSTWQTVDAQIVAKLDAVRKGSKKVRVLTGSSIGPTMQRSIDGFLAGFTDGRHVLNDAISYSAIRTAHARTHGRAAVPRYRFDRARLIVSFDADFLGTWLSPVEFTRAYTECRDVSTRRGNVVRHVQLESRMSLSGANADRRVVVAPGDTPAMIAALAHDLSVRTGLATGPAPSLLDAEAKREVAGLAAELWIHRGKSLAICGLNDPDVQVLINVINVALGNYEATIDLDRPSRQRRGSDDDLAALLDEMESGDVGALVIQGANPGYDLPSSYRFQQALTKVGLTISLNPRLDETSARCDFICPTHHFLESWDDAEPIEGIHSLVQPTVAPLFATRNAIESFLQWSGDRRTAYDAVRATWLEYASSITPSDFTRFWEDSLRNGVREVATDAALTATPPDLGALSAALAAALVSVGGPTANSASLTAVLYEKSGIRDGTHAGNPWLQEFPDPISRITWGNYACVSPELASARGLEEGNVVAVRAAGGAIELPIHIQPGQHREVIAIAVGYGRTHAGVTGSNLGANAFTIVDAASRRHVVPGVTLIPLGTAVAMATVQPHASSEGRDLVRRISLDKYLDPEGYGSVAAAAHGDAGMWPEHEYGEHKWGMTIDLNACTGCGACVLSCQAENNIPVVGRQEIVNQREMHWIRIDRYFDGRQDNPTVGFQPMLCAHCDNASCENVCPVLATVHSSDGLNMQTYNRCVGTRYCANNCALKARRFNWFEYGHDDAIANLALNPDVTVRSRGVMEKCTFCVQRIQVGKIEARNEGRAIGDGEITTACQQSCPAQAISFGNLADRLSDVSRSKRDQRSYVILEEINMRPAVSYLAAVRTTREA